MVLCVALGQVPDDFVVPGQRLGDLAGAAAYADVAPEKRAAFSAYFSEHLAHCIDLHLSSDLISGDEMFVPLIAVRV